MKKHCETIQGLLQEYLDGALADAAAREVRGHVDSCPRCAHELEVLARLEEVLRAEPMAEPPGDLAAAVRRRVTWEPVAVWQWAAMAAASIALVATLFWLGEGLMGRVWGEGPPASGAPGWLDGIFGMDEAAGLVSYAGVLQAVSQSWEEASCALSGLTVGGPGGLALIALIASALLALGTDALCLRQARGRCQTTGRL